MPVPALFSEQLLNQLNQVGHLLIYIFQREIILTPREVLHAGFIIVDIVKCTSLIREFVFVHIVYNLMCQINFKSLYSVKVVNC